MSCQRCDGLMVEDHVIDREEGGDHYALRTLRCINCGDVVDTAIARRRQSRSRRAQRLMARAFAKQCEAVTREAEASVPDEYAVALTGPEPAEAAQDQSMPTVR